MFPQKTASRAELSKAHTDRSPGAELKTFKTGGAMVEFP